MEEYRQWLESVIAEERIAVQISRRLYVWHLFCLQGQK